MKMYRGSSYELFIQSIFGFLVIAFVFIPFLRWAFTSKSQQAAKKQQRIERRQLKRELRKIKRK